MSNYESRANEEMLEALRLPQVLLIVVIAFFAALLFLTVTSGDRAKPGVEANASASSPTQLPMADVPASVESATSGDAARSSGSQR